MLLTRLRLELKDAVRHDPRIRTLAAYVKGRTGGDSDDPQQIARSIVKLCHAARLAGSDGHQIRLKRKIRHQIELLKGRSIDWAEFEGSQFKRNIETGIVLKPQVSARERGVVFISFEYEWSRLMLVPNLQEFARSYKLVLSPSWSPLHSIETTLFPAMYPDRLFSLISHTDDMKFIPRLSEKMTPVELYASNWVNPEHFPEAIGQPKDIDLIVLANFSPYKRHFALFRACGDMPRSARVVLVGRPLGDRTAEVLRSEAAAYGVEDRFELVEGASDSMLGDLMARSRTSAIFSRQEGSCVAIVEAMFSNTPVGMYRDAHIGSRAFINEQDRPVSGT